MWRFPPWRRSDFAAFVASWLMQLNREHDNLRPACQPGQPGRLMFDTAVMVEESRAQPLNRRPHRGKLVWTAADIKQGNAVQANLRPRSGSFARRMASRLPSRWTSRTLNPSAPRRSIDVAAHNDEQPDAQ